MNTQLQILDMMLPVGSLEAYVLRVNSIPMLSAQEEHDLAVCLHEHNDLEAARRLVMSHLRFVVKIARGYRGYGLPEADLIQEGNVGLMKAVKRFDPKIGVRLVSFAVHWIKAEIHEFVLKNWRIVKIATTKAQRKLFFNLRSLKKRLGWFTQEEVEDVARTLNVEPKTVLEMEARLNDHDMAFDGYDDDNSATAAPARVLNDSSNDPARLLEGSDWQETNKNHLYAALEKLDQRSQAILAKRWLSEKKTTLQDLADEYQISAERVRQLETQALKKLKEAIPNDAV